MDDGQHQSRPLRQNGIRTARKFEDIRFSSAVSQGGITTQASGSDQPPPCGLSNARVSTRSSTQAFGPPPPSPRGSSQPLPHRFVEGSRVWVTWGTGELRATITRFNRNGRPVVKWDGVRSQTTVDMVDILRFIDKEDLDGLSKARVSTQASGSDQPPPCGLSNARVSTRSSTQAFGPPPPLPRGSSQPLIVHGPDPLHLSQQTDNTDNTQQMLHAVAAGNVSDILGGYDPEQVQTRLNTLSDKCGLSPFCYFTASKKGINGMAPITTSSLGNINAKFNITKEIVQGLVPIVMKVLEMDQNANVNFCSLFEQVENGQGVVSATSSGFPRGWCIFINNGQICLWNPRGKHFKCFDKACLSFNGPPYLHDIAYHPFIERRKLSEYLGLPPGSYDCPLWGRWEFLVSPNSVKKSKLIEFFIASRMVTGEEKLFRWLDAVKDVLKQKISQRFSDSTKECVARSTLLHSITEFSHSTKTHDLDRICQINSGGAFTIPERYTEAKGLWASFTRIMKQRGFNAKNAPVWMTLSKFMRYAYIEDTSLQFIVNWFNQSYPEYDDVSLVELQNAVLDFHLDDQERPTSIQ